mmetsp:Transcript_27025/g.45271  ORF Transcript_27025/g.45271 Transcript_27025/m.45271 type:complete len:108 (-) Transcript_27025:12-335(-)
MPGKGVKTKHSAASLNAKIADALTNKGGGKAGVADRKGGVAGHAKFKCPICALQAPSIVSMAAHHESKHSKVPFDPEACKNSHEENGGVTTAGVAVKGSKNKKKEEK